MTRAAPAHLPPGSFEVSFGDQLVYSKLDKCAGGIFRGKAHGDPTDFGPQKDRTLLATPEQVLDLIAKELKKK